MMLWPAKRYNRQSCDSLRSCATPQGRCLPDFTLSPLTLQKRARSINPGIDVMCQQETFPLKVPFT